MSEGMRGAHAVIRVTYACMFLRPSLFHETLCSARLLASSREPVHTSRTKTSASFAFSNVVLLDAVVILL